MTPRSLPAWPWLAFSLLALAVFALTTRYVVADCPSGMGNSPQVGLVHVGCYVLDRWTGRVRFERR
jgi:hypothetical protein